MKVRLIPKEIYAAVREIAEEKNELGEKFIFCETCSQSQIKKIQDKVMLLLNSLNSRESQHLYPEMYLEDWEIPTTKIDPSKLEFEQH